MSADDVRAARRRSEVRLVIPPEAIVTPLAREEAARHGIELVEAGSVMASGAAPPRPHAPTCDPDDVERIVERVRTRVPHADPAAIREIARRVLESPER